MSCRCKACILHHLQALGTHMACNIESRNRGRTMTMVREESMLVETSVHRKSTDTRGSSTTAKMPFMGPLAAVRKASFTSSAKVFFSTWMTRSTIDTLGVGTRSAMPAHTSSRIQATLKKKLFHACSRWPRAQDHPLLCQNMRHGSILKCSAEDVQEWTQCRSTGTIDVSASHLRAGRHGNR